MHFFQKPQISVLFNFDQNSTTENLTFATAWHTLGAAHPKRPLHGPHGRAAPSVCHAAMESHSYSFDQRIGA